MLIKSKILLNTCLIILGTVLLIVVAVFLQVDKSLEKQTESLTTDLIEQARLRGEGNNKVLIQLLDQYSATLKMYVGLVSEDQVVAENLENSQNSILMTHISYRYAKLDTDFLAIYDSYGKLVATRSNQANQLPVEFDNVMDLPHVQTLNRFVKENRVDQADVEIGYWEWHGKGMNGGTQEKENGGIMNLAAAIIVNNFNNSAVGYVIAGKKLNNFASPLKQISQIANVTSVLCWKMTPIAWGGIEEGFAGGGEELLRFDENISCTNVSTNEFTFSKAKIADRRYYSTVSGISDYNNKRIGAITVGEEASIVTQAGRSLVEQGKQTQRDILVVLFFVGVFALVLGIISQWYVSATISNPIRKCMEFAQDVSLGNLNAKIDIDSNDEIGQLAKSLRSMIANIKEVQQGVRESVEMDLNEVAEILTRLSAAMDEKSVMISEESSNLAPAAKQVSDVMTGISTSAGVSQDNMNSITTATSEMNTTILEISQNTSKANTVSKDAVATVQNTSESMEILGNASQDIGVVLDVIEEIAEQIELLALNAKIEASRAGEAGKGFGVVANEIKELSKQANEATVQIRGKIHAMQDSTDESLKNIVKVKDIIRDVNDIVSGIASAVEEQTVSAEYIAGNIGVASEEIRGVVTSVTDAANVTNNMAHGIAAVDDDIADVKKTAGAMYGATLTLTEIGKKLTELVAKFG